MRMKAIMQARADRRRAIESKAEHAVALWAARASGRSSLLLDTARSWQDNMILLQPSLVMLLRSRDADSKHCQ